MGRTDLWAADCSCYSPLALSPAPITSQPLGKDPPETHRHPKSRTAFYFESTIFPRKARCLLSRTLPTPTPTLHCVKSQEPGGPSYHLPVLWSLLPVTQPTSSPQEIVNGHRRSDNSYENHHNLKCTTDLSCPRPQASENK